MKNNFYSLACMLGSLVFLLSCATSSITHTQRKQAIANSKETTDVCFVKLNDGTTKQYTRLKLVTGTFVSPYLLADGKIKIKGSQIIAYQNTDHYAVSQKTFCCGRLSYVATETLPGFAIRTVKGKLNVYCKKYFNGQAAVDEFFLQSGNDGKILAYSPGLMNELLKDDVEALTFFNNRKFKGRLNEKLQTTAKLYNDKQFMSKN